LWPAGSFFRAHARRGGAFWAPGVDFGGQGAKTRFNFPQWWSGSLRASEARAGVMKQSRAAVFFGCVLLCSCHAQRGEDIGAMENVASSMLTEDLDMDSPRQPRTPQGVAAGGTQKRSSYGEGHAESKSGASADWSCAVLLLQRFARTQYGTHWW